ncbi:MAG: hypothetical protein SO135_02670, partial [Sphaerochaetaceae bacterium]|nr:hypothetical protein [Sphaerochaetaceae bacterium]
MEKKKVFIKKRVVLVKPAKETVTTVKPVESKVSDHSEDKPPVKAAAEKKAAPVASTTEETKKTTAVSMKNSRSLGSTDPLRNGPVIIRDNNLPPINFNKTGSTPVPSAGGPRQMGVVGGRDFSRTSQGYRNSGYQRNDGGGYNRQNGGGYNRQNGGGYNRQ